MNKSFKLFARLTKIDEAKREVWGLATSEVVDKDEEIFDYESSKPYFKAWSDEIAKATDGKSLGNVREMHQSSAVGKLVSIEFDDANKAIPIGAKIIDDAAWKKCSEGVYTGFSIGGRYMNVWPDGEFMRFTAQPVEVSVVDNPAVPTAHFTAVKADGTTEVRKFAQNSSAAIAQGTVEKKVVDGKDLGPESFAFVGDPKDPSTWKLPIHDESHIRNAIARFNQTELPPAKRKEVARRIIAAARKHGIDPSGFEEKYGGKSMEAEAVKSSRYSERGKQALSNLKAAHESMGKCMGKGCAHEGLHKCLTSMNDMHKSVGDAVAALTDDMQMPDADGDYDEQQGSGASRKVSSAQHSDRTGEQMKPEQEQQLSKAASDSASALAKVEQIEAAVAEAKKTGESVQAGLKELADAFKAFVDGFAKTFNPEPQKKIARTTVTVSKEDDKNKAVAINSGKREGANGDAEPGFLDAMKAAHQNPVSGTIPAGR